jgi:putative cell wall-binding protein
MKKFSATILVAAVLAVVGVAAPAAAADSSNLSNVVVQSKTIDGGFSINAGNWPH